MEKKKNNDAFLRDLLRQEEPVRAPKGFTVAVMGKVQAAVEPKQERVLSTGIWIAILLGAAALVTTFVVIDMPFLDRVFSSSGMQKASFNLFTNQFSSIFGSLFAFLQRNLIGFMILLAFIALVIVERVVSRRKLVQSVMVL
jgi:hypothetical protein